MNAQRRREIFQRLQAANPHPTTELVHRSAFELLIAVMLSAQATDKSVNIATATLFPVADTPEKMLSLGDDGLKQHIRSIGLYPTKAKNVIATCQILLDKHAGEVPRRGVDEERSPTFGSMPDHSIFLLHPSPGFCRAKP